MSTKVEVGQIWYHPHGKIRYQISRVGKKDSGSMYCWARLLLEDGTLNNEEPFGGLSEDGTPGDWRNSWHLETPTHTSPVIVAVQGAGNDLTKTLKFFRASAHPENCDKCGAPKPCTYH